MNSKINLKELVEFLVEAKINTYANSHAKEIKAERPSFRELEYKKGKWEYRDSYCGFFFAPGQEIVRYNKEPIWAMAYSGGMNKKYHGDISFAKETFGFLKKALAKVNTKMPYRGPKNYSAGDYKYINTIKGNITDFSGIEKILYKGKVVFKQEYIGGLIIAK
ncbi:MAG: DUF5680 domain-containing protein [archaeon]|jgi:hypothetical protein